MARLSISELTTYRWTFEEDVARYARAGIPGIGVWRQKLSDFGEERGIDLLLESGLEVTSLLWAGGFTGSDWRSFREAVADGCEAVQLAGLMHADCLVVYSGARNGHILNHAQRLVRDGLRELADVAAEYNVDLALEPMHPGCAEEWTFLTSLDEALAALDAVNRPRAKLAFDCYHLGHDPGIVPLAASLADRIAVVHLGDAHEPPRQEQNRCRLGEGRLPLRELIQALVGAGYQGGFEVELHGEAVESADYDALLRHSKAVFARLTAMQTA